MQKYPNLTSKRILKRHKKIEKRYHQDEKLHETIEQGSVGKKEFLGVLEKIKIPYNN